MSFLGREPKSLNNLTDYDGTFVHSARCHGAFELAELREVTGRDLGGKAGGWQKFSPA